MNIGTLTQREVDVLQCMADYSSLHQVADKLHVSYNTVKWYTRQIYGKLDVNSREEAIKKAWGIGLLNKGEGVSHNLPAAMSEYVGREQELAAIKSLLIEDSTRILTILATGGMGKTRLALETAYHLLDIESQPTQQSNFTDGIFFVSLAAVESSEFVLSVIGSALKFKFHEGPDPQQQLLNYLRDKNALLILDNFEHVLEATPLVIEMLRAAPGVKVLVTSRERLKLNSEIIYTLDSMSVPKIDTQDDILQYDAARLFLLGARRFQHDLQPNMSEISDINRICNLTSGMPLAIILAAAWLGTLSIHEIAEEIANNLDILYAEMHDIPIRLHSVRAVFEAVLKQMTTDERDVFLRLSVFRGGCTRAAAEQVAGAKAQILNGLMSKALVTQLESGRYTVHELLRQYGEEHLKQSSEIYALVCDKHCFYYSDLIAQWEWWNHTKDGYQGMKNTAEADWDNVTLAWTWAGQRAHSQRLWQLSYPVACIPWHNGWYQEAAWLHAEVIDAMESQTNIKTDALLLGTLSAVHAFFCNYLDQTMHVESSAINSLKYLELADPNTDQPEMVTILRTMAMDLREVRPTVARQLAVECIRLCKIQGKVSSLVWAIFEWVMVEFVVLGNVSEAKPMIEEALQMAKQQEIANLTMHFTHLLGAVRYQEGDLQAAKRLSQKALQAAHSYNDKLNSITPLVLLGDIALKEGNLVEAQQSYLKALIGFDDLSRKPRFALALFVGIADLFSEQDKLARATELASFVKHHPFRHAYWSPHERAEILLDTLATRLPRKDFDEASDYGRVMDIDSVFNKMLADLTLNISST